MSLTQQEIDLGHRPDSYFGPLKIEKQVLARIKGELRRKAVAEAIDTGVPLSGLGIAAVSALDDEDREFLGRIHPVLMGGEYLPDIAPAENEIARIFLHSTLGDVVSVRARQGSDRIRYRVLDEYEGITLSGATKRTSKRPLTLQELERFLWGAWDLRGVLEMNGLGLLGSLDFVEGSSQFYPQFGALVERRIHEWVEV